MHGNGNENNSQTFTHAYTNTLCAGKKPKKPKIYKNHLLIDMCVCTSALAYVCLGVCESLIFFSFHCQLQHQSDQAKSKAKLGLY